MTRQDPATRPFRLPTVRREPTRLQQAQRLLKSMLRLLINLLTNIWFVTIVGGVIAAAIAAAVVAYFVHS